MLKILKPDFEFSDERGSLVQLVHSGYKQVNAVTSKAGAVRGGHCHELNTETFYIVSGSLNITVSKDSATENYSFSSGDMFSIEPFVFHTIEYIEDTVLVVMYDYGVELDGDKKDIIS